MPKYAQTAIASTTLYDTQPGASKPKLYGFFSDKRARTWTGPARDAEVHPEPVAMPIGYDARKAFILAKSHVPLKRDVTSRKLKRR